MFLDLWSEFECPSFLVLRLCQGSWWLRLFAYRRMDGKTSQYVLVYIFGIPSCRGYDCLVFPSRLRFVVQKLRQRWKQFTTGWKNLPYEYSCFSLLLAARNVSPGGTCAPQRQKFHTDDVKSVGNMVRNSNWST